MKEGRRGEEREREREKKKTKNKRGRQEVKKKDEDWNRSGWTTQRGTKRTHLTIDVTVIDSGLEHYLYKDTT